MKKRDSIIYLKKNWMLYLFLLPTLAFFIVYHFIPMIGMSLAFMDYRIIGENEFVGLKHFKMLFSSPQISTIIKNTVVISLYKYVLLFPLPIIIALLIDNLKGSKFRKVIQCSIYLPKFLSWVIITGIWMSFLSRTGAINDIIIFFTGKPIDFLVDKRYIRGVLVFSEMWRSVGWDTIIYIAAILGIPPMYYEAAEVESATTFQKVFYITIPMIIPTIITVFILNLGFFMNAGFEQILNFMNDATAIKIDVLDTYAYRMGLVTGKFSLATAVSFFKSIVGLVLIMSSHFIAKKATGKGIW